MTVTFIIIDDYDQDLKNLCWGSAKILIPNGWLRGLRFNDAEEATAYGLRVDDGAPKSFLMIVQGVLLKHLLYSDVERRKVSG